VSDNQTFFFMFFVIFAVVMAMFVIAFRVADRVSDWWYWKHRPDTSPVTCKWLSDQAWQCGHCQARNGYGTVFCHFCHRGRLNEWDGSLVWG
jgi:hypothetical protein